jgi:hypothetical protein
MKLATSILLVFFLTACNSNELDENEWARVGDKVLTSTEIQNNIPNGLGKEDSAQYASEYITNWVERMVELEAAEKEIGTELAHIEEQVNEYKQALILYEFEKRWLKTHLDSAVTEEQITAFYNEKGEQFKLNDFVFNYYLASLPLEFQDLSNLENAFNSNEEGVIQQLVEKGGGRFISEKSVSGELFAQTCPVPITDKKSFVAANQQTTKYSLPNEIVIIKLSSVQEPGSVAGKESIVSDIRTYILNSRRKETISKMKKELVDQAKSENRITTK